MADLYWLDDDGDRVPGSSGPVAYNGWITNFARAEVAIYRETIRRAGLESRVEIRLHPDTSGGPGRYIAEDYSMWYKEPVPGRYEFDLAGFSALFAKVEKEYRSKGLHRDSKPFYSTPG